MESKYSQTEWKDMVNSAINSVLTEAGSHTKDSSVYDALTSEPMLLRQLLSEVENIPAGERSTSIKSRVMALSVRENLWISDDVLGDVGLVYDIYRRWGNNSDW